MLSRVVVFLPLLSPCQREVCLSPHLPQSSLLLQFQLCGIQLHSPCPGPHLSGLRGAGRGAFASAGPSMLHSPWWYLHAGPYPLGVPAQSPFERAICPRGLCQEGDCRDPVCFLSDSRLSSSGSPHTAAGSIPPEGSSPPGVLTNRWVWMSREAQCGRFE